MLYQVFASFQRRHTETISKLSNGPKCLHLKNDPSEMTNDFYCITFYKLSLRLQILEYHFLLSFKIVIKVICICNCTLYKNL